MIVLVAITAVLVGVILTTFYETWRRERAGKATPFTGSDFWREFDNIQTVAGARGDVTGVDPEVGR